MHAAGLPELETIDLPLPGRVLKIAQAKGLGELVRRGVPTGDEPFWACVWPSAQALAQVVADLGDLSGKRVLELGCGPGAPGLVAAARGAQATLTDIREQACLLAQHNAALNQLNVEALVMDWDCPAEGLGTFDGILAADVLYGDGMMRGVLRLIRRHLAPFGVALIADPNRVMPAGIQGAGRLAGLQIESLPLQAGGSLLGGVTLHRIQLRPSPF